MLLIERLKSLKKFLGFLLGLLIVFVVSPKILRKMRVENFPSIWFGKYSELKKYIAAQAILESGNYTNLLSKKYNNIFGMQVPTKRPFVRSGTVFLQGTDNKSVSWSVYDSHLQAVQDLMLWMDYNNFPTSVDSAFEYANEMKRRKFFEVSAAQYSSGLSTIINKYGL